MRDRIVMPIWTFGLFIVVMNTTMFNVSLPSIIGDLDITKDLGSWVVSSYSIGYALTTVIYSRLSDTVPIRKLLAIGLTVLGLSSVLGLFADRFELLLAARILQSAGAGAMAGLGLVLVSRYIPAERRGRAVALIAAGSAMAFGLGPIVGGVISEYFGWNGLFAVTCLVLLVLPVLLKLLPKETNQPGKFDVVGALLTVANTATLLLAVMRLSFVWFAASVVTFAIHAWHIRRSDNAFINVALLKQPGYRKLVAVGFCILVLNLGNLFLMPLALSELFCKSALAIGLFIAPGAVLSATFTPFIGRWIDKYGNLRFLLVGHVALAGVMLAFSFLVPASPYVVLCGYLFFSPAFSSTMASLNNETSLRLPKPLIGSGMGLLQLIQFFGGSLSVAVCGRLLEHWERFGTTRAFGHVYQILLAVSLVSFALLISYRNQARRSAERATI